MIPYYVLYSILFIMWILGNKKNVSKRGNTITVFFFLFCLIGLVGFRHQSMGIDLGYYNTYGYLDSFDRIGRLTWGEVLTTREWYNYEYGYIVLNKLIASIYNNRQFFLFICAFLAVFPIGVVIKKKSQIPFLSFVIYMGLPVFLIIFSGLRQAIAIAICFMAIHFIEEKKLFKFILSLFIASLFHSSAWIFLVAYPIFYIRLNKLARMLSIIGLFIIFTLKGPLFMIFARLVKKSAVPDNNGSITLFLVFVLIYIFTLLYTNKNTITNGYRNIFYLACLCQAFGGIYSIAIRVGYYFMIILVLLLPNMLSGVKSKVEKALIIGFMVVAFAGFGLYSLHLDSWYMTNPYIWGGIHS